MDKKTLAVLAAALFGLAACGSGSKGHSGMINTGGDSTAGGASAGSGNAGNTGTGPTVTVIENKKDDAEKAKPEFGVVAVTPYYDNIPPDEGSYKVTPDLGVLEVNGRSIKLLPDEHKNDEVYRNRLPAMSKPNAPYLGSGSSPYREHGSWSWVGNDLKNAKYGELHDAGERHYQFAQGMSTPEDKMPKERGIVQYRGKGTHTFNELDEIELPDPEGNMKKEIVVTRHAFLEADVDLKVDFGEKTLIGEVTPINVPDEIKPENITDKTKNPNGKPWHGGVRPTIIKAVITDGNRFKGDQYLDDTVKTEVEGGFYGEGAEEIAGVYYRKKVDDPKKWSPENYPTRGVFGVKKQ